MLFRAEEKSKGEGGSHFCIGQWEDLTGNLVFDQGPQESKISNIKIKLLTSVNTTSLL